MHYVWQMNNGSWQISRTTNSKAPRLACEDHGYDTKREAYGALAYAKDCNARPNYDGGKPRAAWRALDPIARESWERDPRPRFDGLPVSL